jgi:hypothetical protein
MTGGFLGIEGLDFYHLFIAVIVNDGIRYPVYVLDIIRDIRDHDCFAAKFVLGAYDLSIHFRPIPDNAGFHHGLFFNSRTVIQENLKRQGQITALSVFPDDEAEKSCLSDAPERFSRSVHPNNSSLTYENAFPILWTTENKSLILEPGRAVQAKP